MKLKTLCSLLLVTVVALASFVLIMGHYQTTPEPLFTAERVSSDRLDVSVRNVGPTAFDAEVFVVINNKAWRQQKVIIKPGQRYTWKYIGENGEVDSILLTIKDGSILYERII